MKKKQPQPEETAPELVVSSEDLRFEEELARAHPTRKKDIFRFDFPDEVPEAAAVYMFVLRAKDEITAADMADANMTANERKSHKLTLEAERRESIRLSIAGIIMKTDDGELGERRVIDQAAPLMELDEWGLKAWAALRTFFGELNGLPLEELGKAVGAKRKLAAKTPAAQPRAVSATASDG